MSSLAEKTFKNKKSYTEEVNDSDMALIVNTYPLIDKDGEVLAVVYIVKDMTKIKMAEKDIKEAKENLEIQTWGLKKTNEGIRLLYKELERKNKELQKIDEMKSDFVSTVSHELRTPLSTMKEFTSIVLDGIPGDLNKDQKEYLKIVKGNIERLARLISDLLDISKIESGKLELKKKFTNIIELVEQVLLTLNVQAKEGQISMKTDIKGALPDLYIDPDKITQIFVNLIGNAIKFTPENGSITVEVKDIGDFLECSVIDTGKGIAKEDMGKLFSKFQQFDREPGSGAKGTGLGLAICKKLIEMHGGEVWAESKVGQGSQFSFTLPKHTAEEVLTEIVEYDKKHPGSKRKEVSFMFIPSGEIDEEFMTANINSIFREGDVALKNKNGFIVVLMNCGKDGAKKASVRLKDIFSEKSNEVGEIESRMVSYPEDVEDVEKFNEFIEGVKNE